MTARILDGKATLAAIKAELTDRVAVLASRGVVPGLGTVLVGDDPGSSWYVGAKHKDSAEIGVTSIRRDLPATATQDEVEAVIDELNADPDCTGFLVQQPTGLDEMALLSRVDPGKDIDGLHPTNLGWLVLGKPAPLPCTPMGVHRAAAPVRRPDRGGPRRHRRPRHHRRATARAHPDPQVGERDRHHLPHRDQGPRGAGARGRHRRGRRGRPRHHHRRHGQARCRCPRRRRLTGRRQARRRRRGRRGARSPAGSARTPAASGR